MENKADLNDTNGNVNDENELIVDSNKVYTRNKRLIAKIVYQCVDCNDICITISDVRTHYHSYHLKNGKRNKNKNNNIIGKKKTKEKLNKLKRNKVLKINKKLNNNNNKSISDTKITSQSSEVYENCEQNHDNQNADQNHYECDYCDNSYTNIYSLRRHNKIHTNPEICDHPNCGKKFATERELVSHLECHNVETKSSFKCEYCTKIFKREVNLKIHVNIHTNPIICDYPECNKKLATKARLKEHLLSHSSETPLKCDWPGCDFAAKVASNLKSHSRTHTGERPFHCCWPGCGQSFAAQSTLNCHIESRHEIPIVKRFKCEWPACESSFSKKSGLKDHRRTHTGEKPYHCIWPNCGQSFSTMSVLHNHKLTHTGERRFHCDIAQCSAKFATSSTLNTHKKLVHKCDYIKRSRWDNKRKLL